MTIAIHANDSSVGKQLFLTNQNISPTKTWFIKTFGLSVRCNMLHLYCITLLYNGHMLRVEENKEVRATVDMIVPGKRPRGRLRGRWIASEGTCRNCGSPRRMPRTEHFGNQVFGRLTPASGPSRRRRTLLCNKNRRRSPSIQFSYRHIVVMIIVRD